jgi:superfamily II DNA/RNA helicase
VNFCAQIHSVAKSFCEFVPNCALQLLVGGKSAPTLQEDIARLRTEGGNMIVATPGRLEAGMWTLFSSFL